jgi:hypothetical protein
MKDCAKSPVMQVGLPRWIYRGDEVGSRGDKTDVAAIAAYCGIGAFTIGRRSIMAGAYAFSYAGLQVVNEDVLLSIRIAGHQS